MNTLIAATSGWQLARATDINDRGQIVGHGFFNGSFDSRGFLLTPQDGELSSTSTTAGNASSAAFPARVSGTIARALHVIMVKGRPRIMREQ